MSNPLEPKNNRAADLKELIQESCDNSKQLSQIMTRAYGRISNLITNEEKQGSVANNIGSQIETGIRQ